MLRTSSSRRPRFLALVALALVSTAGATRAADRDEDLFIRPEDQRSVLFSSVDHGRSTFVSAGSKQTLVGPLDRTGYVVIESAGFGITRERTGGELRLPLERFTTQAAALFGYQLALPGLYLAGLAGPELDHEQVTVAGRFERVSEPRIGARGQIELWANPTRDTMLTETIVGGTTRGSVYTRTSAGYRIHANLFAGPEVTVYATSTYRETKIGAHLTGIDLGILHLRASGGWMTTDDGRPGSPYVGLTAWIRM